MTAALDTYAELRLAEGKLLRWGEREVKAEVALQPRDLEILAALARYRFLTTGQSPSCGGGRGLRAVRRRMSRVFEAGFVERFRPQTLRGSYQWTYCLARDGFRAAEQTGQLAAGLKFAPRREAIFDYRYVIHDLRTNEWVLRYRELLDDRLLDWAGADESRYEPPKKSRDEEYFSRSAAVLRDTGWYESGIEDEDFRPVQPDALLDVATADGDLHVFVEYDCTRRVDKNYDKFRRYDALLTSGGADERRLAVRRVRLPGRRAPPPVHLRRRPRAEQGACPPAPAPIATSATSRATGLSSFSRATSATPTPRRCGYPRCHLATSTVATRRACVASLCRASTGEINAVPPGPFPSSRSALAFRSERTRAPTRRRPKSPSRLCCTRKGDPPLRAGPPFLDMPDKSGQGSTGGKRSERRRVGAKRTRSGARSRGKRERDQKTGCVIVAMRERESRVGSESMFGVEREQRRKHGASGSLAGTDARSQVLARFSPLPWSGPCRRRRSPAP